MDPRQTQRAGTASQQVQVAGDLVLVQGVTEERAAQIAQQAAREVLTKYSEEAAATGAGRIEQFDTRLVGVLAEQNALAIMADPAFQVLLRKAQLSAASSERDSDYEMLASLLGDRAVRDARPVRASIDRAVQVVDLIDDHALNALTVVLAVEQFVPSSGLLQFGLDALDTLFAELCSGDLPGGGDWLDHLDTLDALRPGPLGLQTLKKLGQFWGERMTGYLSTGVATEDAADLILKLGAAAPPGLSVVAHELKPGFSRVAIVNEHTARTQLSGWDPIRVDEVLAIARQGGTTTLDSSCVSVFEDELAKRQHLKSVKDWWNGIPNSFQLTGVGRVIGRANAKRLDVNKLLPVLE